MSDDEYAEFDLDPILIDQMIQEAEQNYNPLGNTVTMTSTETIRTNVKETRNNLAIANTKQKTLWDFGTGYVLPGIQKSIMLDSCVENVSTASKSSSIPFVQSNHKSDIDALNSWIYPTVHIIDF